MDNICTCSKNKSDQPAIDVVVPEFLACGFGDPEFIRTIVAKHHKKLRNIAKKSASGPVKCAIIVTMTLKKIDCDLGEFKAELGGRTRSSSKADLPALKLPKH